MKSKRNKTRFLAGVLALSLLMPQAAFAADPQAGYDETVEKLMGPTTSAEEKIQLMLSNYGATSLQYALVDGGEIVTSGHDGVYSKEENKALTVDSMYGIGSVSKMFTTVVILKLAEEGRLDLDQPITRYLPGFRMADSRYKDITVRMLLSHSSGLMGSSYSNSFLFGDDSTKVHDDFLTTLSKQSLKADPGAFSVYCNDGFTLAELVAERITGKSFTQLIHTYITQPLGMKNTKTPQDSFERSNLVKTYWPEIQKALPVDSIGIIGTGGIYSTAEDMCRFLQIFMANQQAGVGKADGQRVLSKETAALTGEKEFAKGIWPDKDLPEADGFGLGWDSVADEGFSQYGIKAMAKGGDTFFYHGSVIVLPEYNMAAVVLSSGGASPYNQFLAQELLMERLKETGKLPNATIGAEATQGQTTQGQSSGAMPTSLMENNGYYANMGGIMKVEVTSAGALSITVPAVEEYEESYTYKPGSAESSEGVYFMDPLGLVKVSFEKETNGKTYLKVEGPQILPGMGVSQVNDYTAQKLEPAEVSKAVLDAWKLRDGKTYYQLDEKYTSSMYLLAAPAYTVNLLEELPGYVLSNVMTGPNDAKPVLEIPGSEGRDLSEIHLYEKDGVEYLTDYAYLCISQDAVKDIEDELSFKYTIGADGYAVWKTVGEGEGRVMTVISPERGAFFVYDDNGNCINNSLASGVNTVELPEGGTICFAGDSGQTFQISIDPFADVKAEDWYYEAAGFALKEGLFSGTEKYVFAPEVLMTQSMLSTVLTKMNADADVSTLTEPDKNVTRQQLVTAIWKYAKSTGIEISGEGMAIREFSDEAGVTGEAREAMSWAIGAGILTGKPGEGDQLRLDPLGEATRAEAAQMLMKLLKNTEE